MSIIDFSKIEQLAKEVYGKLWLKGDKTRIYVNGGNNYHYQGKWYYEIYADGTWEAKLWLEDGYNNKKREEYVEKYLKRMERSMEDAIEMLNKPIVLLSKKHQEIVEMLSVFTNSEPAYLGEAISGVILSKSKHAIIATDGKYHIVYVNVFDLEKDVIVSAGGTEIEGKTSEITRLINPVSERYFYKQSIANINNQLTKSTISSDIEIISKNDSQNIKLSFTINTESLQKYIELCKKDNGNELLITWNSKKPDQIYIFFQSTPKKYYEGIFAVENAKFSSLNNESTAQAQRIRLLSLKYKYQK